MLSVETVVTFTLASIALGLAPGPDNIFVLTQSMTRGSKAGLLVTLGLCTGLVVHSLAVAFGVAALFEASAVAFTVLKIVGALYLLFLGWQAFRKSAVHLERGVQGRSNSWRLYVRGSS